MGTVGVSGDCFTGPPEVARMGRAMGTVKSKGIAVEIGSTSSGNSCRSNTLSCEFKQKSVNKRNKWRLFYR